MEEKLNTCLWHVHLRYLLVRKNSYDFLNTRLSRCLNINPKSKRCLLSVLTISISLVWHTTHEHKLPKTHEKKLAQPLLFLFQFSFLFPSEWLGIFLLKNNKGCTNVSPSNSTISIYTCNILKHDLLNKLSLLK